MLGPPEASRRVVVTVSVVLRELGCAIPCHIRCTESCAAGVLVAVEVRVEVAGHGSASEVKPLALIIQLPGNPKPSIVPTVSLMGSPRLATFGGAALPLPTTQDRTCD